MNTYNVPSFSDQYLLHKGIFHLSDAISIVSGLSDIPIHMLSIIRMPFLKRHPEWFACFNMVLSI